MLTSVGLYIQVHLPVNYPSDAPPEYQLKYVNKLFCNLFKDNWLHTFTFSSWQNNS